MSQTQTESIPDKKLKLEDNECPECGFKGDKRFPKGFAQDGRRGKHCPKCGFWELTKVKGGN